MLERSPPSVQLLPLRGKRILIIVENLPVPFDRRVWQEALALKAAGAEVTIICPRTKDFSASTECLQGIQIYRHSLPVETKGTLGYLREYASAIANETWLAWRIFFKRRFDIIHACNPPDLIFLTAVPFKLFGVKFIFDHHDLNPELFEAKFNRRGGFWHLLRILERLTFFFADASIATNESYRKVAVQRGHMDPDHAFIVRSAPDVARFRACEPVAAHKNGKQYLIGYVGVMGEQEGVDLLLHAAHHLVRECGRSDVQFCLVGGGPSLDSLRGLAEQLGLSDYVTFTGRVPDRTLLEVLSTADICVNPDRVNPFNAQSTMNKIMEYMALAKPMVQFDMTEGRVSAGASSLYAKPNDPVDLARCIDTLLEDPERRARMGKIGQMRLERRLGWDRQIPELIKAYESALGLRDTHAPVETVGMWIIAKVSNSNHRRVG